MIYLQKSMALGASLLLSSALTCPTAASAEANATVQLSLPPQPLNRALTQIGRSAGVEIIYDAATVRGKQAPALVGTLPTDQALVRVLSGSGLEARRTSEGAYVVERSANGQASTGEANAGSTAADDAGAASEDDDAIVVTGTLIRGIAPTGTNVKTMSREDIVATGATNTNQLLAKTPQIANTFNQIPTVPLFGPGATVFQPNLRNLGAGAGSTTLVLMDGHRLVTAGSLHNVVDPDVIPPDVIERVDVVPDGGSAIYGSDAVGGVINFITRKKFDGFEMGGHLGFADNYTTFDTNITAGKEWGSGSGYISYVFAHHDAIFGRDRDYVRQVSPDGGFCAPGTVRITRGAVTTRYALPGRIAGTQTNCDFTDNLTIYPRESRHSVFAGLTQEISDKVAFDVRAFYTRRKSVGFFDLNQASGFNNFGQVGTITSANPYYVPINDPVNGPDTGVQSVLFTYTGVLDSKNVNILEEYQITPSITAGLGKGWELRVLGAFGRSSIEAHAPWIDTASQAAALAGTTIATALNPYNIAATNQTVLASIFRDNFAGPRQGMTNGRIIVDGPLAHLPGGDVHAAVGVEYLRQTYDGKVGFLITSTDGPAFTSAGNRNVYSAFGEVVVPIVGEKNAIGGIQELVLSLSGRYDHYSDFGSTFNPKIGVTYRPADWLKIRGNWGKSFNAPGLADVHAPDAKLAVVAVSPWRDPADSPANFFRSTVLLAGGNPNLGPQKARTWSIGIDVKPPVLPGLSIGLTYYNINLKGQIGLIPFTSPAAFTPAYASFITKNPTLAQLQAAFAAAGNIPIVGATSIAALYPPNSSSGPYVLMDARRQNLGIVKQDGIDFNVSYSHETSFGSIDGSLSGTYTLGRKLAPIAGAVFVDDLKSPGRNRFNFVATAGVGIGQNFYASIALNHSGGYGLNPPVTTAAFGSQDQVDDFNTVDLFFKYSVDGDGLARDLDFMLNLTNLFDQDPPFYNVDNGYINGGTFGRMVQFGVKKKF